MCYYVELQKGKTKKNPDIPSCCLLKNSFWLQCHMITPCIWTFYKFKAYSLTTGQFVEDIIKLRARLIGQWLALGNQEDKTQHRYCKKVVWNTCICGCKRLVTSDWLKQQVGNGLACQFCFLVTTLNSLSVRTLPHVWGIIPIPNKEVYYHSECINIRIYYQNSIIGEL